MPKNLTDPFVQPVHVRTITPQTETTPALKSRALLSSLLVDAKLAGRVSDEDYDAALTFLIGDRVI